MGLFGTKKTEVNQVSVEKNQPAPEGTVIGEGITFVGTFTADELIDIRGKVEGEIISPVEVLVSKTGKHEGTMDVEYLTVDGTIDSDIHCRNTVTLRDDCQVFGTMYTPRLNAQDGSNFHGTLNLEKDLAAAAAEAEPDAEVEVIKAVNAEVIEEPKEEVKEEPKAEVVEEPKEEPKEEEKLPTMEEVLEVKDFSDLEDFVEEASPKVAKKAKEIAESADDLVEFME